MGLSPSFPQWEVREINLARIAHFRGQWHNFHSMRNPWRHLAEKNSSHLYHHPIISNTFSKGSSSIFRWSIQTHIPLKMYAIKNYNQKGKIITEFSKVFFPEFPTINDSELTPTEIKHEKTLTFECFWSCIGYFFYFFQIMSIISWAAFHISYKEQNTALIKELSYKKAKVFSIHFLPSGCEDKA